MTNLSRTPGFTAFGLLLFFMEETYAPIVLVEKASELRRRTKNWGIHAKQEEIEVDFKELIVRNVSRPLRILFTEPICLLVTIYMSFVCKLTIPLRHHHRHRSLGEEHFLRYPTFLQLELQSICLP